MDTSRNSSFGPLGSRELYEFLIEQSRDVIWIMDLGMKTIFMSSSVEAQLGFTPEEYKSLALEERIPPESLLIARKAFTEIKKEIDEGRGRGISRRIEMQHRHKNGRLIWGEVSISVFCDREGRPKGIYGITRNIEERKRWEGALTESEERYRDLVELLPFGIFECDLDVKISFVNDGMYAIFGYEQNHELGPTELSRLVLADEWPRIKAAMARQLAGERPSVEAYTALRREGGRIPIEIYSVVVEREGKPVGFRGAIIDVSEKKRYEAECLKTNKLEVASLLAGGIAHDFNNILAAVMGNISLAELEVQDLEKQRHLLKEAEKAILRARDLTQRLLTFSRGDSPSYTLIDIAEFTREIGAFNTAGSNVFFILDAEPDLPAIWADRSQITQLVQNLVINAIQAMPSGGRIHARLARESGNVKNKIPHGEWVRLDIEDEGPGVAEGIRDKIFDPYFTTKTGGSGLGLAICLAVARGHGGDIAVGDTKEGGARFTVRLPASSGTMIPPAHCASGDRLEPTRGLRILFVDDEENLREIAEQMALKLGYLFDGAADAQSALELWDSRKAEGEAFDIVFVNLTIRSGNGGLELLKGLRLRSATLPIIISSGYFDESTIAIWKADGFSGILRKPYDTATFVRTIEEAVARGREFRSDDKNSS